MTSDPVTIATLVLRVFASALALYNLRWSYSGAIDVARGHLNPPALYLSVIFWMSIAVLTFQAVYFIGATPPWRLLATTLLVLAMSLAAIGHRMGSAMKARQFYSLYDHLGPVLAISDLARVDVEAAERIAEQCRSLTAAALVLKRG